MHQQAIEKYLEQLAEIKERGKVFQAFSSGATNAIYEEATVEVVTLQLRRILEILAFGFVLAIGEKAIPAYASFVKYKNVEEFFTQLKKINENFYPQPVDDERGEDGQMQWNYPAANEYLTSNDFITLFEHCDLVIEPRRVGALPMSLEQCKAANIRWHKKIVRLLNAHLIDLNEHDIAYLFQMCATDVYPTCDHFRVVSEGGANKPKEKSNAQNSTVTLVDHLRRQLEFLRRSCELYDAGHLDESVRMAVVIRVLIHDTNMSESVLYQMSVKNKVKLVTSFGLSSNLPKNFQPTSILPLFANSAQGGTSVPFRLPVPAILMSVDDWWNETVWMQDSALSRRKIILETANKEGGAHVQPVAPKTILELRRGLSQISSVKVNGVEVGTPANYHFILIRQFAHELLNSPSLTELAD